MRKIALAFLALIINMPAFANIHIKPDTVVSVVKQHVAEDKINPVIREYNAQLKASNGTGIAAAKLWNVCAAAGWNIKDPNGKQSCKTFVNALVKSSVVKFYEVCKEDGAADAKKQGAQVYCVKDFFTNKVLGGTQVSQAAAIELSKEYARIKHNDGSLQCSNNPRKMTVVLGATDYVIKCASKDKNAYYEFVFDDIEESEDKKIQENIMASVCKMYDADATKAGCAGGGNITGTFGSMGCWGPSCAADAAKCAKIDASLQRFGYGARMGSAANECQVSFNTLRDASELKTAFGIDNFVFCGGIQVRNDMSVEAYLKQYIAQKAGVAESAVRCDAGVKTYTGAGCNVNGIVDFKDDVKTCYAKGQQIDFVFDDINESWNYEVDGGKSAMSCIINAGGRLDGKHCRGLSEKECRDAGAVVPGGTDWDKGAGACVLKDVRSAKRINNGITIATGVVITVGTLGAGAVAGAGVSGTTVLVAVAGSVAFDAAFVGLERLQETKPHHRALQFITDAKNCNNATCAADVTKTHLARLSEVLQDLNNDELNIVAGEMDRIAGLQTDEQFVTAMNNSTLKVEDYALEAGSTVLIAAAIFVAPEDVVKAVWGRAAKFASKMEKFMTGVGAIGTHADDITKIAGSFGKQAILRQSSTLGGKYYYRIMVRDGDNVAGIISSLQSRGWHVSAASTTGGEKFIAASRENIFGAWDNSATNWLKYGNASGRGKIGQDLVDVLTKHAQRTGARVPRADANGFIGLHYGHSQCATGLKFHVSVQKDDLEKASLIIDDLVRHGGVADMWKVHAQGMVGAQLGKDFTIYVSPNGYDKTRIQEFINNLEDALRRNNIRSNGVGANILSGDKKVAGSNYINYRYDRINDMGYVQSGYNGSYNFVAPSAEYGGDIMDNVRVW